MKRALVCGAGGFIGGHLIKKLKREGYWVRGVDIKEHEFAPRRPTSSGCWICASRTTAGSAPWAAALSTACRTFDEVYQLGRRHGRHGLHPHRRVRHHAQQRLINIHMIDAATKIGVGRYFFSSSACVYRTCSPAIRR